MSPQENRAQSLNFDDALSYSAGDPGAQRRVRPMSRPVDASEYNLPYKFIFYIENRNKRMVRTYELGGALNGYEAL